MGPHVRSPPGGRKRVFIIGGGNSAGQAAMFLADRARSVTVLVRQIVLVPSIRVEAETQVVSADGTDCLKAIKPGERGNLSFRMFRRG